MKKGELKFTLDGKKLTGSWALVRARGFGRQPGRASWLLIKHRDEDASAKNIALSAPYSVRGRRLLADIARDRGGNVAKAATGDPKLTQRAARST